MLFKMSYFAAHLAGFERLCILEEEDVHDRHEERSERAVERFVNQNETV